MDEKRSPLVGLTISGCLLGTLWTFIVWFLAAFMMYGTAAGDCFQELSSGCPSDHQRNLRILVIAVAALGLNFLGFVIIGRVLARRLDTEH